MEEIRGYCLCEENGMISFLDCPKKDYPKCIKYTMPEPKIIHKKSIWQKLRKGWVWLLEGFK